MPWFHGVLLGLVRRIARRPSGVALLILIQTRPELVERRPQRGEGLRTSTSLQLEPLDLGSAGVLGELGLADVLVVVLAVAVLVDLSAQARGNPLLAEELFAEELVAPVTAGHAVIGEPEELAQLLLVNLRRFHRRRFHRRRFRRW